MVSNKSKFFIALVFAGIVIGCDSEKYFEEYKKIENASWAAKKQLSFKVESIDTHIEYNLFLLVRNTKTYTYQNLYLFMDIMSPSGKMERDTIECLLADITGKWYGDHAGDIVDNKIWFKTNYQFSELGTYRFTFEQAMREESLTEIIDFGLRIEKKQ
ncbi:MAG: gliding motility lipoprotein GldH [Flavobacteriales bacterium]|nr:gliding motility lipoprotein GldH [Flavobacteriales bacterium]